METPREIPEPPKTDAEVVEPEVETSSGASSSGPAEVVPEPPAKKPSRTKGDTDGYLTKQDLEAGVTSGRFTRDEVESYKKIKAAYRAMGSTPSVSTRTRLTLAKGNATKGLKEKLAEINNTIKECHAVTDGKVDAAKADTEEIKKGMDVQTAVAHVQMT